jgi:hypothetical protein
MTVIYKPIATTFDDTNDAQFNDKHNVQLIRKCVLSVSDYLDRYCVVDHWLPLAQQHSGFNLYSSPDDVAQIDLVTWSADGCTYKLMVFRIGIGSSFPQCSDAVTNAINIPVDVQSTDVQARFHFG